MIGAMILACGLAALCVAVAATADGPANPLDGNAIHVDAASTHVAGGASVHAGPAIRLAGREVFFEARPGVCVRAESFYVKRDGLAKMRFRTEQTKSDKMDMLEWSFSDDNGRTWSQGEPQWVVRNLEGGGTERRGFKAGWVDPVTGYMLILGGQGVWPNDRPADPANHGNLMYYVSTDGGHTFAVEKPIIQKGFTAANPFEGVWSDKNSPAYGDRTGRPIRTRRGHILQPMNMPVLDTDGNRVKPASVLTFTQCVMLIGTWTEGGQIDWQLSQRVAIDASVSSRGLIEPTIAELPDGRIIMVMRGHNDGLPGKPGYKWLSVSSDGGFTWTPAAPWTYHGGENFFSPGSCSQFVAHSSGRIYWIGNIVPGNPKGGLPRRPMVIGQVDPESGLLIRATVVNIDDRAEGESEDVMLSNFMAHEDRQTKEILVHMSRPFVAGRPDWTSPAYLYRIAVE